ncbi:MAG: hypothetical protein WCR02_03440 [Sphaerochaetaceae bacterium]|jgi:hypothetical protein
MDKRIRIAGVLLLLAFALVFVGCSEPSVPVIASQVQGYGEGIVSLVFDIVNPYAGNLVGTYTEGNLLTGLPDTVTARVDDVDADGIGLALAINDWVASDGTVVRGTIDIDFSVTGSPLFISNIDLDSQLGYNHVAAIYRQEFDFLTAPSSLDDAASNVMGFISLVSNGVTLYNYSYSK